MSFKIIADVMKKNCFYKYDYAVISDRFVEILANFSKARLILENV